MSRCQQCDSVKSDTTQRVKRLIEHNQTKNRALKKLFKHISGQEIPENIDCRHKPNRKQF